MKKIAFLSCLIFMFLCSGYAQKQDHKITNEDRAEKLVDKLEKALNLTDQQEDRLEDIFENSFKTMKAVKENNKGDKEATKAALLKNHEDTNIALQQVLTPEQYKQYLTWQQNNKKDKEKCSMKKEQHKAPKNNM